MRPLPLSACFGATGVLCAAFGAHGLERYAVSGGLRWWAIGVVVQLTTTPALLALEALRPSRARTIASLAFTVGLLLFSGSLYAMALGAPRGLGAITPLGGLSLVVAWIATGCCRRPESASRP